MWWAAPMARPRAWAFPIGDTLAATYAALGATMALHARTTTGRGQVVDSAIYEAVLAMMESLITEYQQAGYIRERTGPILPGIAPSNVYPTADGQMILIAANQNTVFRRLAAAMQQPGLAEDARYATHVARGERQAELDALIAAWTSTLPAEAIETLLEDSGVPAGRIYRAPEIIADPHVQARNAIIRILHPEYGELAMQNVTPRLSDTPGGVRHVATRPGCRHRRRAHHTAWPEPGKAESLVRPRRHLTPSSLNRRPRCAFVPPPPPRFWPACWHLAAWSPAAAPWRKRPRRKPKR